MDAVIQRELIQTFSEPWNPPYSGSIYAWARENVSLTGNYSITGKFDVQFSRYLIKPFEALLDDEVEQVNAIGARQTFKSGLREVFLLYIIANDAGPVLQLHQTDEKAQSFTETRLIPLLNNCPPVKNLLALNRHSAKKRGINLPHMSVLISGPKESALNGPTIRYLFLDEAHLYPNEALVKAKATTITFTNRKILISSTPGVEGDELSQEIAAGILYEWGWVCPECKNLQPWYWNKEKPESTKEKPVYAGIKWDKVLTADGKNYDYEATGDSARLVCYHCPCEIKDTPNNRMYLNDTGDYVCTKANGNKRIHTYTWNAFAFQKTTFKEKVIQYLQAKAHKKQTNISDALRIFNQHVLGKEWPKYDPITISKIIQEVYDPQGQWADEAFRFMGVDYQKRLGEKWYVIRAVAKSGESRLITYGHVHEWDDIQRIANANKVLPWNVFVDSGFNADEVYGESVRRSIETQVKGRKIKVGWTCVKGSGLADFKHADGARRYYQETVADPLLKGQPQYAGRMARLIVFSDPSLKMTLFHLRDGKGAVWKATNINAEYERQLSAEVWETVKDEKTGLSTSGFVKKHDDNHLLDCEKFCVLGMYLKGLVGNIYAPVTPISQSVSPLPLAA